MNLRHPGQECSHPKLPWPSVESKGYIWDQFGPSWSKALSGEALLLPLTTEVVKDEHTLNEAARIKWDEFGQERAEHSSMESAAWQPVLP